MSLVNDDIKEIWFKANKHLYEKFPVKGGVDFGEKILIKDLISGLKN